MGRSACLALLLGTVSPCIAQMEKEYELAYRRSCVRILRDIGGATEVGSGHVLFREGDSLLIATARHVVQDSARRYLPVDPGVVELFKGSAPLPYRVAHLDQADLAFIKVREPAMKVLPAPTDRGQPMDSPVWVISARKNHQPLPYGINGQVLYRSSNGRFFWADIPGVQGGDSGSMVIGRDGVIGMVMEQGDDVKCLEIGYILDRLQAIRSANKGR